MSRFPIAYVGPGSDVAAASWFMTLLGLICSVLVPLALCGVLALFVWWLITSIRRNAAETAEIEERRRKKE